MIKRRNLGLSFSEEVTKVTNKIRHFKADNASDWIDFLLPNYRLSQEDLAQKSIWRIVFFSIVCILVFFIIFLRLFHLQIVYGRENRELADNNRIQIKVIYAPRGVIFDRFGKVLVANSPAFRLNDPDSPGRKARLVSREEALEWEVNNDPRFLNLEVDHVRTYLFREKFSHLLGFMGEISSEQLKQEKFIGYRMGDVVGQTGIEAQYEKILRGKNGGEIIEVDSLGRKLRTLRSVPAVAGQNIYLSVDTQLQERLYQHMQEALGKANSCCGAAAAIEPDTGKILALVSFPSFDPNIFSKNNDDRAIDEIFARSTAPILNRVTGGVYPPASTFKIVSSLAALAKGVSPDMTIEDSGVMYLGPYQFSNWYFNRYGKVEGAVNMQKALMRSNDIYFYKIAQIIGEKAIADWARKLYMGRRLDIDLPEEAAGVVPDDDWKQKTYSVPWYPGDTLHMSIGQGFVLATPLQVLGITSFMATGGNLYQPQVLLSEKSKLLVSNIISQKQIDIVKGGLELVSKQGGTAWPFFNFPVSTAGKTGTAEFGDPKDRTHAWYTSFAPVDDPEIALVILIEGGGEGSSVAAPVAKEVYRWYFSPDKNKLIQDIYTTAIDSGRNLGE